MVSGDNEMKSRLIIIFLACAILAVIPLFAESDESADRETMKEFLKSDIVRKFNDSSYGYAVFPTIGKGGLGIGGAHGKGRVYRNGIMTGEVSMTQLSIGFQAGGQAYSQVIFFENKKAYDEFTAGNFEFGAQAEAVAITVGAGASIGSEGKTANTDKKQAETEYYKGMAVFTMAKGGLMYQASIGGQKYKFEPVE